MEFCKDVWKIFFFKNFFFPNLEGRRSCLLAWLTGSSKKERKKKMHNAAAAVVHAAYFSPIKCINFLGWGQLRIQSS